MTRVGFNRLALCFWGGYMALLLSNWQAWSTLFEDMYPGSGPLILIISTFITALLLVVIQAKITDAYFPLSAPDAHRYQEENRLRLTRQAANAVNSGDYGTALRIYEDVELYADALRIAERMHDREALVRLYTRLRRYEDAQKHQVELKDYEGAAWSAALMGDISSARQFFKQAAMELDSGGGNPRQRAGLWDRAGYVGKAALLYEEAGDLPHAAECFELAGDVENAHSYARQAKAFRAYELSMGIDRETEQYREDLARSGHLLEDSGDLFGAAETYREAGLYIRAATLFERFQEWERAARCYDLASMKPEAERARRQIQLQRSQRFAEPPTPEGFSGGQPAPPTTGFGTNPGTPQHGIVSILQTPVPGTVIPTTAVPITAIPSSSSNPSSISITPVAFPVPVGGRPMPLPPSAAPAVPFVPAITNMNAPMFIAATPGSGLNVSDKIANLVRQSRFAEAAEVAKDANDWAMAAALYDQGGELLTAADLYRQIGRIEAAASALERADCARDAALLSLAGGNVEHAVKVLLCSVAQKKDKDLALLLGQILVEEGAYSWAFELLHDFIAPEGVDAHTAEIYYRFARLYERRGAIEEAFSIYNELLKAGAVSEDITSRHNRLAKLIAEPITPAAARAHLDGKGDVMAMIHEAVKEMFIRPENAHLFQDVSFEPVDQTFEFAPPEDLTDEAMKLTIGTSGIVLKQELSLFGSPAPSLDFSVRSDDSEEMQTEVKLAHQPLFSMAGRYAIKRKIAQGGMGIIYEALDTMLDRSVALKVIQRSDASQAELAQFLLEARVVARLSHPAVITIYDVGLVDLKHYIAMEMMRGGSVRDYVKLETQLSLKEAIRLFTEVSRGLQAAHEAGIVHLDIKPTNLLLSDRRHVKIVDFGVARLMRSGGEGPASESKVGGTPGFMAPEQIRGEEMLPRADIYALGITLYYMLVGEPPYRIAGLTSPKEILQFQLQGNLPSLRDRRTDVPSAIDQLYRYCTALDPAERYQNVDSYLAVAEQWCNSL